MDQVIAFMSTNDLTFDTPAPYAGSQKTVMFSACGKFVEKTYYQNDFYMKELEALTRMKGTDFAPVLYAAGPNSIIMERIYGISVFDYYCKFACIPPNFHDLLRIQADMAALGIIDYDCKVNQHVFWQNDGKIRVIDFDNANLNETGSYGANELIRIHQGFQNRSQESIALIGQLLSGANVPDHVVNNYIDSL